MKLSNDFKQVFDIDFSVSHPIDVSYKMDSLHFHNVFEIYLAQTGGLKYFVDNIIYPVEKNDLFVFNHLDLHRISIPADTQYDRYIVLFSQDYIKDTSTDITDLMMCFLKRSPQFCHRIHLSDEQAQYLISLFRKAEKTIQPFQFGDDVYKKIILAEILIYVNNLYRNNNLPFPLIFETEYNRIKLILSFIDRNLEQKLSLDWLSQHFYISKYHLCKIFKNATGFTIKEYIIYRRILKATELLRKGFLVSQVSEMAGFQNDCHFITTFKKYAGTSPKQYAKRISS
jgi:AraC-like DNA-binding protein